ncbi:LicD family protein [Pectobacterium versatile]|uniref:LicD family protein n=1 Tax=Pectobacterium versatile TaxID=2488639 RepID=UPI000D1A17DD|nr:MULTISPECIES: LicD family protein [Pectobacterium]AVT58268.1 LicD family protein [Pectobacterium versatile]MCL6340456.1 LicD family protein [Pectobacterium carotovorum subsp. carotovorum]MCL6344756.1 LicD family protein [Pectobacterium carotovorum subsp. carotovorum]
MSGDGNTLEEMQMKSMHIFSLLIDFLEKNNIKYIIDAGTLIGAVRHQGFIPWDDDLDISILRPDYERLLSVRDSLPFPLQLSYFDNDPKHVYPFLRIHDISTSVTINYINPVTRGVWIDIFPIDGTFENVLLRKLHISTLRFVRSLLTNVTGGYVRKPLPIKLKTLYFFYEFLSQLLGKEKLIRLHYKIATLKKTFESKISANIVCMSGEKTSQPTLFFSQSRDFNFGHVVCKGPVKYDEYLTKIYGDYMTPPPLNQRLPSHPLGVVDLKKSFMETDPLPYNPFPEK